jgi:hypothetical protein
MRYIPIYLLSLVFLAVAVLGTSGCASAPTPIGVDKNAPKAVQTAQGAINEARIALGAAYGVVAQHKTDGIITAAERDVLVARLDKLRDDVAEAEKAMSLGDLTKAGNLGSAARSALLLLQRELAQKARKDK